MELHPSQAGFRHGYSTITHLVLSDEISKRNCPHSIFLDLKAAFDSVNWMKLNDRLIQLNCPEAHRLLIMSLMCRPATLLLSVNDGNSVPIRTQKGVFQGGVISPLVFAVYINELAERLNAGAPPHRPFALLFADDIELKPKSKEESQRLLNICSNYAIEYDLIFNHAKSAVVVKDLLKPPPPLLLSGLPLPVALTYKYLGGDHSAYGVDWASTLERGCMKQTRLLSALSFRDWHPASRLIIYRVFVRPISEYVLPIAHLWAVKQATQVRKNVENLISTTHKKSLAFVFGINPRQYHCVLDEMTGMGSWLHRVETLKAAITNMLGNLHQDNPFLAAKRMFTVQSSLEAQKASVIHDLFLSKYLADFKRQQPKAFYGGDKWKSFLHSQRAAYVKDLCKPGKNILLCYYQPKKVDQNHATTLFREPPATFAKAIKWRLNILPFFNVRFCGVCQSRLTRTHAHCFLYDQDHGVNTQYANVYDSPTFLHAAQALQATGATNLTVFDHLLNMGSFDAFLQLYDKFYSLVASHGG